MALHKKFLRSKNPQPNYPVKRMKTIKLKIRGRVQGVGYRYFALRKANDLDIKGRVRNCPDGSVELFAQGSLANLSQFIAILKQGPAFASVNDMQVDDVAEYDLYKDFRVIH